MSVDQPVSMQQGSQSPRGTRLALLASLALNTLLVGGLVSAFVRYGPSAFGAPGPTSQRNLGAYVSTLPAERGDAIMRRVGEKRRALGPTRRELRTAREDALAALTSEPFDKDRFLAAQTRLIEVEHAQRLGQRDVLAEIAGSMTPEERRAYVRWRGPPRPIGNEPGEQPAPGKQ